MILIMANGEGILEIESDKWHLDGCETCDYGSRYVNEFKIKMTTGIIEIKVDKMYEYAMSEGQLMLLMLPNVELIGNMTEQEFFTWIKKELSKAINNNVKYSFDKSDISIEFNSYKTVF